MCGSEWHDWCRWLPRNDIGRFPVHPARFKRWLVDASSPSLSRLSPPPLYLLLAPKVARVDAPHSVCEARHGRPDLIHARCPPHGPAHGVDGYRKGGGLESRSQFCGRQAIEMARMATTTPPTDVWRYFQGYEYRRRSATIVRLEGRCGKRQTRLRLRGGAGGGTYRYCPRGTPRRPRRIRPPCGQAAGGPQGPCRVARSCRCWTAAPSRCSAR